MISALFIILSTITYTVEPIPIKEINNAKGPRICIGVDLFMVNGHRCLGRSAQPVVKEDEGKDRDSGNAARP